MPLSFYSTLFFAVVFVGLSVFVAFKHRALKEAKQLNLMLALVGLSAIGVVASLAATLLGSRPFP